MNILQLNKFYYPYLGGIERVVQTIAEYLAENNHSPTVLTAKEWGWGTQTRVNNVPVTKTSNVGTVQSVPIAPSYPIRYVLQSRTADIVHHHLPNPLSVVSHLMTPKINTPLVVSYHSDIIRQSRSLALYEPFLEQFLQEADRILVGSPPLLESSEYLSPFTDKCEVVPFSVNLNKIDEWRASTDSVPDIDGPVVLFVGRLVYYKGIEYLVDAMKDVDATLLIVGEGQRRSALEERVAEQGLSEKIQFLGWVPDEDLHNYYDLADLFVLPSVEPSEAFGIVQIEAMAHQTPVVNTDLPTGVPWVSQDGETGNTVPPRDASALAAAINDLLENPKKREAFGENARRRVENTFSDKEILSNIVEIYCEVLQSDRF